MKNKIFLNYVTAVESITNTSEYVKYKKAFSKFKKVILIGNGGSNSIASHISQDMTKFHNKNAFSFSDPSMLTCFINDFGMSKAYVKFLNFYSDKKTLVILISSSGESKNIINCVTYLEKKKISYGVLTGFNRITKLELSQKMLCLIFILTQKVTV